LLDFFDFRRQKSQVGPTLGSRAIECRTRLLFDDRNRKKMMINWG